MVWLPVVLAVLGGGAEVGMKTVETRLGTVAYREMGHGPTVVLLHAAAHDHHDYDGVMEALSQKHRVLAVDWPGHGASPMTLPSDGMSVVYLADVLDAFLDTVATEPVTLVGNSVGGYAAVRQAAEHPERVRALVLVNSGGFSGSGLDVRVTCAVKGKQWFTNMVWNMFPQLYSKRRTPWVNAMLQRIRSAQDEDAVARNAALWRSFATPEHDLTNTAPQVRAPTLLVWGSQDPVISMTAGRRAARLFPEGRLVELPTGHVVFAEDPAAFLQHVLPFLEQVHRNRDSASTVDHHQLASGN